MKKIMKKVETEIYEACDGETFETESECEFHEWFLKTSTIPMMNIKRDSEGNVTFEKTTDIENCDVIHVRNEKDLKLLENSRDYLGFDMPKYLGTFIYLNLNSIDEWVRLETLMIKVDTLGK